ncbi:DMP19 family protein [Flavobacterium zhairuonense]|uniref:DMP19 family protein n=1 Tax=Flavobacterium zhairuonense TaxID=2493631 RepID=UPI001F241B70|nr:DMP19 family protein [Flavobacterium zhairuonense]
MAKGPEKNTKNKALHTKLLNRKKAKLREEKEAQKLRLKEIVAKSNQNNDIEMEEFGRILVSETAMNSENPQDVIHSNISVINLMREEGVDDEFIHEDALTSYYLDYYWSQYTQGNFAQFVHNSGWNKDLNELIEEGLALIGAEKHLELFLEQSKKVRITSNIKLDKFLKGKFEGANPLRDSFNTNAFFELEENLVELNANFLKTHPDFEVLSVDDMFAVLEEFVGHEIKRA